MSQLNNPPPARATTETVDQLINLLASPDAAKTAATLSDLWAASEENRAAEAAARSASTDLAALQKSTHDALDQCAREKAELEALRADTAAKVADHEQKVYAHAKAVADFENEKASSTESIAELRGQAETMMEEARAAQEKATTERAEATAMLAKARDAVKKARAALWNDDR